MEEKQPKLVTIIVGINGSKVLMHQRKKEPFFNYWGFPGGKVKFGETIAECAAREFFEETGLKGDVELKAIIDMKTYNNNELAHHHYHHIFVCRNTSGELIDTEEGPNKWVEPDEIKNLEQYPDVPLLIDVVKEKGLRMIELKRHQENGKFAGMEILKDMKF